MLNSNLSVIGGKRRSIFYSSSYGKTSTMELYDNVSYLLAITYFGLGTKYSALYYVDSAGYIPLFEGSNISDICTISITSKVLTINGKVYNFESSLMTLT